MAYDHLATIKSKASKLSALTSSAGGFLTTSILNVASRRLYNDISEIVDEDDNTLYDLYMAYLDTEAYSDAKLFYNMTALEKKYDGIITAETYLALSILAVSLKKVDKNSVFFDKETFGGDALDPSGIEDIIKMAGVWKSEYSKLLNDCISDEGLKSSSARAAAI
jgi:hypothetical protein